MATTEMNVEPKFTQFDRQINSDAEAFRAKPVSSELRLTGHDRDFLMAIGIPCRLSWQDPQHDRLADLTRKNRAKFRKQFEREVVELMRRTIARTPFVPLLEWLFR
jgi:hypothetical protein